MRNGSDEGTRGRYKLWWVGARHFSEQLMRCALAGFDAVQEVLPQASNISVKCVLQFAMYELGALS